MACGWYLSAPAAESSVSIWFCVPVSVTVPEVFPTIAGPEPVIGESRFPFHLTNWLEPPDEIGGHFQSLGRQDLEILDNMFETAHNSYGTPA